MYKLILPFLAFLITTGIQAQDPVKQMKKARSLFNSYKLDQSQYADLKEAAGMSEAAMTADEAKSYKNYALAGNIFLSLVGEDNKKALTNPNAERMHPEAPLAAYNFFMKSSEMAVKKFEISEAHEHLRAVAADVNLIGFDAYNSGEFATALDYFEKVIAIDDKLKVEGAKRVFAADSSYQQQLYFASAMATNAGINDKAELYTKKLIDAGFKDASLYSNMYKVYETSDMAKAEDYLAQGRAMFPDNATLLFTEINHFLKQNRLEDLISKLEMAIEKEPKNISVRATMGNVYDQLYQKEFEAGNTDKADEYFGLAEQHYTDALAIDEGNSETNYSLGALYYNRGVIYIQDMNDLADDLSKEGTRKYNERKMKAMSEFDKALPYFEKSYAVNTKDRNTLIALKEIYARKDQLELSNKYKKELDAIDSEG